MSPKSALQRLVGRVPAALLVVAALLGFWLLTRGAGTSAGLTVGYAELLQHSVAPLHSGRLRRVLVRSGQLVRAGEVVALLDTQPQELARARLQAELAQAQARLQAERDLQGAQLQRGELQLVRTSATVERARAELKELNQELARLEGLAAQQLVRASEVEAVRRRQRAAAAEVAAHNGAAARDVRLRPRPEAEQQQRLELRLAPLLAAVQVQEAALREVDLQIAEMTLRAPVDGAVGAIASWPGTVVGAGVEVLSVVTARPGRVVAYVPERLARRLEPGAGARLRRSGTLSGTLRGQVTELAPLIDEVPPRGRPVPSVPTFARRVVIELEGRPPLLPGESFHVSF